MATTTMNLSTMTFMMSVPTNNMAFAPPPPHPQTLPTLKSTLNVCTDGRH